MSILGFRHVGIVVSDLNAALQFYVELLGLTVVKTAEESGESIDAMLGLEDVDVTTVKLVVPGGGMIELLSYGRPRGLWENRNINDVGISHIALTVDDVDAEYVRLLEADVGFLSLPVVSGSAKVVIAFDPDENPIELVQDLH